MHQFWNRRSAAAAATALAATLASFAPSGLVGAQAQVASKAPVALSETLPAPTLYDGEILVTEEEALAIDYAAFSKDLGISVEEVARQIGIQDEMDTIPFSSLDPHYVEDGSRMGREFSLFYRSTGEPPPALVNALEEHGILSLVEFQKVPHSLKDLGAAKESVLDFVGDRYGAVGAELDTLAGTVLFSTERETPQDVRSQAQDAAGKVTVVWEDGHIVESSVSGGRIFDNGCTGGFIVKKWDTGRKGVSSAAHCTPHAETYAGNNVNWRDQSCYSDHDVEWYSNDSVNWEAQFYSGGGLIRTQNGMRSWAAMDIGDPIQKYGTKGVRATPGSGQGDLSDPGDSGGPVFVGGTALGIISGSVNGAGQDVVFYPISLAISVIGVEVLMP